MFIIGTGIPSLFSPKFGVTIVVVNTSPIFFLISCILELIGFVNLVFLKLVVYTMDFGCD